MRRLQCVKNHRPTDDSVGRFVCKKASQSFAPAGAKAIRIIFAGSVYVGKNSVHGAELSETPREQALRSVPGSVELMQSEASK